jgi:RNA polymerase sigma factor (sigma-70 family)
MQALCRDLERTRGSPPAAALRREIWQILYFSLLRYTRYHAARFGQTAKIDPEDIASQKSLELISNIDMCRGRFLELNAGEMPGFLSTIARNGLVDVMKSKQRWKTAEPREIDAAERAVPERAPAIDPGVKHESEAFAGELRDCVENLAPQSRRIWFFRVFYEMPSKVISAHPGIRLKVGHVDVVLQRARRAVRACMEKKGYNPEDMPPGTFVAMWKLFGLTAREQEKEYP